MKTAGATQQQQRHSTRLSSNEPPVESGGTDKNKSKLSGRAGEKTPASSKGSKRAGHYHHQHRRDKPAELYRTDFITAMKLPDTESLDDDSYLVIKDQWKIDWEKGVQVPVKPHGLNRANYCQKPDQYPYNHTFNGFSTLLNPKLVQPFGYDGAGLVVPPAHHNNLLLQHAKVQQKENKQATPSSTPAPATVHKMPKKYLCPVQDRKYQPAVHEAYVTHRILNDTKTNKLICRYDCDEMDLAWLNRVNYEFQLSGIELLTRVNFERLIENFEQQSYESLKAAIDKLQSYSIEYDEGVVCDVCRSPDSEDSNEMVFCDGCNMCVHQACYGIDKIPQGNWLCAACSFGGSSFKPECVLCPNMGGAMKATRNLRHWCHVSCALWIPETGFGNPDKMEPIINLNQVAPYRWQLLCNLCKEKRGCCLQCSEKRCHSAFHVTCAFKHNLDMENTLSEDKTDIEFKAYCLKHSRKRQLQQERMMSSENVIEEDDEEEEEEDEEEEEEDEDEEEEEDKNDQTLVANQSASSATIGNESASDESRFFASLGKMNETERKIEMLKRMRQLNAQFYKDVSLDESISALNSINFGVGTGAHTNHISRVQAEFVFNYWKLKRRFNKTTTTASRNALPKPNKALMYPKCEEDLTNQTERMLVAKVRMFILLRQNLERVRNLTYMVVKREKLKRQFFDINHQLFEKQAEYMFKYASHMHPSILSLSNSTAAAPSSASTPSGSSTSTSPAPARSGRIRDILQIKNENCIYDFPALWRPLSDDEAEPGVASREEGKQEVKTPASSPTNVKAESAEPVESSPSDKSTSNPSFKLKNLKKKLNSASASSSLRIKDKYKNIESKKKAAQSESSKRQAANESKRVRVSERLSTANTSKDSNIENAASKEDGARVDAAETSISLRSTRTLRTTNGFSKENGLRDKSASPPLKRLVNGVLANELVNTKKALSEDVVSSKRARLDSSTQQPAQQHQRQSSANAPTRRSGVLNESSPKKLNLRSSAAAIK